jgi:hypothetical protein
LISYEVISRDDFSIQECNVGSGAPCGAVYLTKGFETLLRRKLGDEANTILNANRLKAAMRYFESDIKFSFNPCDDACDDEYNVPIPGAPDNPSIKLEDGFLALTKFRDPSVLALTSI